MKTIGEFRLMALFLDGAFMANSGAKCARGEPIKGTEEEWARAEGWFEDYWCARASIPDDVYWMGVKADEGMSVFEIDDRPGDELGVCEHAGHKQALPWVILDRYY